MNIVGFLKRIAAEHVIVRRSPSELQKMRASGVLVYQILRKLGDMVEDGTVLWDLEVAAAKMMSDAGAKPAFKNYKPASAETPYPFVLCTSVNHEIVHGMPSKGRKVKRGDIVSIDTGLSMSGYFGDSAITVGVGEIGESAIRLMKVTEEALGLAIEQAKVGNRLFDVSGAVEKHVTANGFSVVREMVGHGIGTKLHEEPQVPNYVDRMQENPRLKEGMVMAIEPMVNMGKADMKFQPDKWTAVAVDGLPSAHFEHVVAVTADGPWILTKP